MTDRADQLIQQGVAEMQNVINAQYTEIERLHGRLKICSGLLTEIKMNFMLGSQEMDERIDAALKQE